MCGFDLDWKISPFWANYRLQNIFAASYNSLGGLSNLLHYLILTSFFSSNIILAVNVVQSTEFARMGNEKKLGGAVSSAFRDLIEIWLSWEVKGLNGKPGMQSMVYSDPAQRSGRRICSTAYVKTWAAKGWAEGHWQTKVWKYIKAFYFLKMRNKI